MKSTIKRVIIYTLAALLTVEIIVCLEVTKQNEVTKAESLKKLLMEDLRDMEAYNKYQAQTIIELGSTIDTMNNQITALKEQIDRKADKSDRSGERGTKIFMELTAYDLSYQSCGKYSDHPEYGISASGQKVKEWCTIAAGKSIPFGTQIYIPYFANKPNKGIFTVQDRGSAIKDGRIDVYIGNHADCMDFGRRQLEVYILE